MIPNPEATWHNSCSHYSHILSCPNAVDWLTSPEERGSKLLSCELSYYFPHIQARVRGESFADTLGIDILISVQTYDESITRIPPLGELTEEVLAKPGAWTCRVFFLLHKVPAVLLV